jgi:AcrR family transcriptional regulator
MAADVKPPRRYESKTRDEQARRTRRAVLAAAHKQFVEQGYAATTIAGVATDAGVSVETVYKAFRNKPSLAKAAFDVAAVGDDEPIPMLQRESVRRNMAEPDPRKKLHTYADDLAQRAPRMGPLLLVLRDAAATDAAAAEVWAQLQQERLTGMTAFAHHLRDGGHLRDGVSWQEARDVLWTHTSVEVWDLLVQQRGWSKQRFGKWTGQQLVAALL